MYKCYLIKILQNPASYPIEEKQNKTKQNLDVLNSVKLLFFFFFQLLIFLPFVCLGSELPCSQSFHEGSF